MAKATIYLNRVEPAPLSLRHPLGIDLDLKLTMLTQTGSIDPEMVVYAPQFVLFPRSQGGVYPYDMYNFDPANSIVQVKVPGSSLTDRNGYNIELYLRAPNEVPGDPPKPVALAARGTLVTEGLAYTSYGPQSMINIPVVVGPPGPQGDPGVGIQGDPGEDGERGTKWTTGTGDPTTPPPLDTLKGDYYLDQSSGNVWQYNGVDWVNTAP
jgi:hypothetical protein